MLLRTTALSKTSFPQLLLSIVTWAFFALVLGTFATTAYAIHGRLDYYIGWDVFTDSFAQDQIGRFFKNFGDFFSSHIRTPFESHMRCFSILLGGIVGALAYTFRRAS